MNDPTYVNRQGSGFTYSDILSRNVFYDFEDDYIEPDLTREEMPVWFQVVDEIKNREIAA